MAACTQFSKLTVTGATALYNGDYFPAGTASTSIGSEIYQFTRWTKDGLGNSNPQITMVITPVAPPLEQPTGKTLTVRINTNVPVPYYAYERDIVVNAPLDADFDEYSCSFTGVYSPTFLGGGLSPTITGTVASSEPTFGLPAESVALIISRFGTVANFLRLRNLGQI
jgi:hypothetical protein